MGWDLPSAHARAAVASRFSHLVREEGYLGRFVGWMSARMNELKQYKSRALLFSTPNLILFC